MFMWEHVFTDGQSFLCSWVITPYCGGLFADISEKLILHLQVQWLISSLALIFVILSQYL